jgi:hypothetical protein
MKERYEGVVVRKRVAAGSKSDREAVVLEAGEDLVLRIRGGNAFADPRLDALVGKRIRGTGTRTGYTLILDEWEVVDRPESR